MVKIIKIATIMAKMDGETLNIELSIWNALGLTFGPAKLSVIITIIVNANAHPIQIKNGISYTPWLFM